jgi:hypothetical protein
VKARSIAVLRRVRVVAMLFAAAAWMTPLAAATDTVWQIEWKELLPPAQRDSATLVPPAPLHDYLLGEGGPAASQPAGAAVNAALDRRRVRLPGFVVPLEIDAQGRVTELLLVPYYGACIHVPPPPPNQIVLVTLAAPLELGAMDTAYWITGRMEVAASKTRLAATAYAITGATTEEYRH